MRTVFSLNFSSCSASVLMSTWVNNLNILCISFPTYNKRIEPYVKSFLALIFSDFDSNIPTMTKKLKSG